jgi:hypothetical protein
MEDDHNVDLKGQPFGLTMGEWLGTIVVVIGIVWVLFN